jgi:hypothetical protein
MLSGDSVVAERDQKERTGPKDDRQVTVGSEGKTEIVVIDISGWIVSGSNLEMGTEHVVDVQITCYGCP